MLREHYASRAMNRQLGKPLRWECRSRCERSVQGVMAAELTKVTLNRRAWLVPSEGRALKGWVEPTAGQRVAVVTRVRQERDAWTPSPTAWDQLIQLQGFVGRQVRIQFWNEVPSPVADDEWPDPGAGHCEGIITLINFGHLQAFLLLCDAMNTRTGEPYESSYFVRRGVLNCMLAPVADLYEVEAVA